MPAFDSSPSAVVRLLTPGHVNYAFGARTPGPPCRMLITNDSVSSNVVTLTVRVVEGNIPAVGDLIYTYATGNSGGALNQTTGIALASVSITAATGIGTVTFPKTVSNQGATADTGYALTTPGETTESLTVAKSQAFAVPHTLGGSFGISWDYTCPSAPGSISIQLEGAVRNVDSEFAIIGSALTTAAGASAIATAPANVNFVRLNTTAAAGGSSPTITARVSLS